MHMTSVVNSPFRASSAASVSMETKSSQKREDKGVISWNYHFYFDHKFTKLIFSNFFILKLSHTKFLRNLSKMQGEYLNTSARRFQIAIHFNLGYA